MAHHDKEIHVLSEQETEELIAHFDRESNVRRFSGVYNLLIKGLLLFFTVYVVWVTLFVSLPEQIRRSAFLGILIFNVQKVIRNGSHNVVEFPAGRSRNSGDHQGVSVPD
jgi:TRAP-type uncharacterized transport system fused permease subunit